MLLRPPHFDAAKKYPMLLLIHGGPQGAWDDSWGYRWNQQVMAAPGYVVVMINPRGSSGMAKNSPRRSARLGRQGLRRLDEGPRCGHREVSFHRWIAPCAAGGSYGGYMIDWIATHTGRFKCLISHAGPYDEVSMYGATEELWFMDWEFGGAALGTIRRLYTQVVAQRIRGGAREIQDAHLVIGGELDFRVPYTQDLEFFTALQRAGRAIQTGDFPRRRTLGFEAAEQPIVVSHISGLGRAVFAVGLTAGNSKRRIFDPPLPFCADFAAYQYY